MDRLLLETQRPVTFEAVRELRHLLEQVAEVTVPSSSIRQRMLLCVSEAFTNLVEHASTSINRMTMRFGRNSRGWWLEVLDNGTPWDPGKYLQHDYSSDFDESESGRGINLMYNQCDLIEYQTSSDTLFNCLRLNWVNPDKNKHPRILVVEDDNGLRRIYSAYLNKTFEVITAISGTDALKKIKENQIDLVLSDICMPQMDGMTLREHLIKDTNTRLIPFVFLTAVNNSKLMEQATNLGIDDYLQKPADKTQLVHTIQRVLKRSQQVSQQLNDRINKNITSSLTPTLPAHSHGWRFALASRHTGIGGGDLLLHQSTESMFQLVLTDIMGHDDNAKFFAHACGGYLHGMMQALETDGNAAQLLEQLSDFAIQDKLLSQVTLTCCSAVLSPEGSISLGSAGHPPPLLINQSGIEAVPIGGVLPGLLANTTYEAKTLQLKAGERIALYTDGLFEAAADESLRHQLEEDITSSLHHTLNIPIDQALNKAMDIFDGITANAPKDDALLLLIEPQI